MFICMLPLSFPACCDSHGIAGVRMCMDDEDLLMYVLHFSYSACCDSHGVACVRMCTECVFLVGIHASFASVWASFASVWASFASVWASSVIIWGGCDK